MARLLIIEDDPKICTFLSELAEGWGHEAVSVRTIQGGLYTATRGTFDLILLDLELPDGNGLHALPELLKAASAPEVIIITGTGDIQGARLAFKYGAWDYVRKPFTMEEICLPVTRALDYRDEKCRRPAPVSLDRGGIIGSSNAVRSCLDDVARAAVMTGGVLITGETGTGKELFARAIHDNGDRRNGRFVSIDCGAIPEALAEGMLFGHEKGAFTGADRRQEGLISRADGGTLFLDEIGDLSAPVQNVLLRVLQEKRIRPLGAGRELPVDFRIVAATHRDLRKMVEQNSFREDLLFRVRALEINLPPIRERGEDLLEIVMQTILRICRKSGAGTKGVSPDFTAVLTANPWPGNVRELINAVEYALASAGPDPTLYPKHLPPEYRTALLAGHVPESAGGSKTAGVSETTEIFEAGNGGGLRKKVMEDPTEKSPGAGTESMAGDRVKGSGASGFSPGGEYTKETDAAFPTLFEFREEQESRYLNMLVRRARGDREKAKRLSGISQARLYGLLKKYGLSLFKPR